MKNIDPNVPAMCDAHRQGDVAAVRALLASHPELETTGPNKHTTWLHLAAEAGQIGVIDFWLERGWDVNLNAPGVSEAEGVFTALHVAKDAPTTQFLLSRGASANVCHRKLGTPLHYAIVGAVEPSQKGRRRPEGANMDQMRALLQAGADLTLMNGEDKGYSPLAWAIHLRRKTAEQVLREVGAPERGRHPFDPRPKTETLDLRRDFTEVYAHLADQVRAFTPSGVNVLGDGVCVKMVEVGFEYSQAGWLVVVFDTRSNAEPDGEWTELIEGNELERPHWSEAGESHLEGPITIVQLDGSKTELPSGTELAEILGDVVKAVLLKARADGVFTGLPKFAGCELGVEHFSGYYGWPADEERGHDNLAETEHQGT